MNQKSIAQSAGRLYPRAAKTKDPKTNLQKYYMAITNDDVLSSSGLFLCGVNPDDELGLITQLLLKVYPVGQRVWGQKAYAPQLLFKMLLMCQWLKLSDQELEYYV